MSPPNKWLFFPTQSSGALQTITINMSSASAASSISSTGQQIVSTTKVSELSHSGTRNKIRLWNGSEAANGDNFSGTASSGANLQYKFTSGTTCRAWWHLYAVSVTVNGGTPVDLNATSSGGSGASEDVAGSVDGPCQPGYINTTTASKASAFTGGDTIILTITSV